MNILFVLDSPIAWRSGIWFHRNHQPAKGLEKRGHGIKFMALGNTIPPALIDYPNTVIFGRTYHPSLNPIEALRKFKSEGKRILYDIDDDFWTVNPENPSVTVSNAYKDQYESFIRECDAVITPSKVLMKKVQKLCKKKVYLAPNMASEDFYQPREGNKGMLIIGYMGAASHWKDLQIIAEPIVKLQKKYNFLFMLYGVAGSPLEAEMYVFNQFLQRRLRPEKEGWYKSALDWYSKMKEIKNFAHIPFYPPELHPAVMSRINLDIGLAPLVDNEFNSAKSNIKFYEYAAVNTVTLASDVLPYKEEVNYRAKNTFKDWYEKLEKLIVDKEFREKLGKEQFDWVKENRSMEKVALDWELACQLPGGLPVRNQQKDGQGGCKIEKV